MVDLPIDYIELQKDGRRSCSLALVNRLKDDIDDSELKSILDWMEQHDDFRVEKPLLKILEDASFADAIRDRASLTLCEITTFDTPIDRATWWVSGDRVLMTHALRMAETGLPEEALLVEAIASDWSSEFQSEAIEKLSSFHTETRSDQIRMSALSHPNSKVRIAAANSLLWDQPVIAELALLKAANDECEDVAVAALDTLVWYTSQNVLLQLHVLRCSGRAELLDSFNTAFNYVFRDAVDFACDFGNMENGKEASFYYQNWLNRLGDTLSFRKSTSGADFLDDTTGGQNKTSSRKTREFIYEPVDEIIAKYSDADGRRFSWDDGHYDWRLFSEAERKNLTEFFLASPDYLIRKISARAFAEWNDAKNLVLLMTDHAHCVRRYACYIAKHHSPDQVISETLLTTLRDKQTTGSFARETFDSYVVHAAHDESLLIVTLEDFARNDQRQEVREDAVRELCERRAERINDLLYILKESPMLTWSLHCRLLEICNEQHIQAPDLEALLEIDDFAVQQELAFMRANMDLRR
jgi:hypothetical protein